MSHDGLSQPSFPPAVPPPQLDQSSFKVEQPAVAGNCILKVMSNYYYFSLMTLAVSIHWSRAFKLLPHTTLVSKAIELRQMNDHQERPSHNGRARPVFRQARSVIVLLPCSVFAFWLFRIMVRLLLFPRMTSQ